ncbi:MAG: tetratricopeptide repeat protein [Sphingomicrobium sp.]
MAQTPDINETFVREVDENLRRDRLRDFARNNGALLVGAVILFLAASAGAIWWQQHSRQHSEQQAEKLVDTYRALADRKTGVETTKQLDELSASSSKAVRASALFSRAVLALDKNDTRLATAKFREVAEDSSLPKAYRDIALIRQTALEFDQLPAQTVVARLAPLSTPDSPWFASAGEMTGLALIKQGKKAQAGEIFAAIAKNKDAPESARQRAIQIASSLGVDATSALPPTQ